MTINDQTKGEKLQYDINREAAKTSVLSSGKLLKYEYLTGEDILPYINNQTKDEKLQYDINREAAKTSVLSSGKLLKYEYLTGEDILPSNQ